MREIGKAHHKQLQSHKSVLVQNNCDTSDFTIANSVKHTNTSMWRLFNEDSSQLNWD